MLWSFNLFNASLPKENLYEGWSYSLLLSLGGWHKRLFTEFSTFGLSKRSNKSDSSC